MKAVVIGGSGFLGSHVADCLTDNGYEVVIYDRTPSPHLRSSQTMILGDILDQEELTKAMRGVDVVYHMAGIADIGESKSKPAATIEVNIIGSTRVIEASLAAGVKRFMFASTVYVYSDKGSFYRVSKQAIELILESYAKELGLAYTILRYGSLYGPRAQDWNGIRRLIKTALETGSITYPGTGEERREYIHVVDAAKLSVAALADEYVNQCLTLTGTHALSSREMLTMIQEILGGKTKLHFEPPNDGGAHYSVTPYRFTPRQARKIVPNTFYDIGQGILDIVEELYHQRQLRDSETTNSNLGKA